MTIDTLVQIPAGTASLEGTLVVPPRAVGVVIFAHGAGSSRLSPRNTFVAERMHAARLGTLLFDLLTEEEDRDYERRFDIRLLTSRLRAATDWVHGQPSASGLPIALFGASTGAAAALRVAAELGPEVAVVVSRGGRPDMAGDDVLARVLAPTLLIVGGLDSQVIELNQQAYAALTGDRELRIVPGATHLFEEPGTLEEVSDLAAEFILQHVHGSGYAEREVEPL